MCPGHLGQALGRSGGLWDEGNLEGVGVPGMEDGPSKDIEVRCISDILEPFKEGRATKCLWA